MCLAIYLLSGLRFWDLGVLVSGLGLAKLSATGLTTGAGLTK